MKNLWKFIQNTKVIKVLTLLCYFIFVIAFVYSAVLDYTYKRYGWFILDASCAVVSAIIFNAKWNELFDD